VDLEQDAEDGELHQQDACRERQHPDSAPTVRAVWRQGRRSSF
jgi:hypothetical protein